MSAAAYVRARISRRSPYHDKTIHRASKGPLDKLDAESATTSVRKETDASMNSRSPRLEHEDYEPCSAQPEAVPLQLMSSRAIELPISCPKPESVNIEECVDVQYGALNLKTPKNNKGARAHLQESN